VPGASASTKAVILVGGEGTRLRPLTYGIPKPMVPVVNRPFLEHTLAYLNNYGVKNVSLTLSNANEDNPLGTTGAVKNVEKYLDSTFIVLNGDIFTSLDIADMVAYHRSKGAKATIALTWVDDPSAFGVVETDSEGRVERFIEKPSTDCVTTHWINAGVYLLEPEVLQHVPINTHYMFEKGLFPLLLQLGEPVYGYPFSGYWLDMGTSGKYLRLNCDLLLSKAKSVLVKGLDRDEIRCDKGVTIHPSASLVGPVVIGSNCRIDQQACIRGPVVIGSDCHIGERASIEGAMLWKGVNVGAGASVKQCILGTNAVVKGNGQVIHRVVTSVPTKVAQIKDD